MNIEIIFQTIIDCSETFGLSLQDSIKPVLYLVLNAN